MPRSKPKTPRGRETARIHILKGEARLDDDTYRDILWVHGKVRSSTELDTYGRQQVIKQLEHLVGRNKAAAYPGRPRNTDTTGRAELRKVEALLADASLPWAYAAKMASTMYKVERLEFADARQLAGIITALEKAAIKRLHGELLSEFGPSWPHIGARYAGVLFSFEYAYQDFRGNTQAMSQVLRWWRGTLLAFCEWPRKD